MPDEKKPVSPENIVSNLGQSFRVVGKHRVHAWYAWAIVGIVFGMALAIVYVANRSGQFNPSSAQMLPPTSILPGTQVKPFFPLLMPKVTEFLGDYVGPVSVQKAALINFEDQKAIGLSPYTSVFMNSPLALNQLTDLVAELLDNPMREPVELVVNQGTNEQRGVLLFADKFNQTYQQIYGDEVFADAVIIPSPDKCSCNIKAEFKIYCKVNMQDGGHRDGWAYTDSNGTIRIDADLDEDDRDDAETFTRNLANADGGDIKIGQCDEKSTAADKGCRKVCVDAALAIPTFSFSSYCQAVPETVTLKNPGSCNPKEVVK